MKISSVFTQVLPRLICNLALAYMCYTLCRIVFIAENWTIFSAVTFSEFIRIMQGGFRFDTAALCYTNSIYVLLILFPLHLKEKSITQKIAKWTFVAVNSVATVMNLMDSVYYSFTQSRVTAVTFSEFQNDNNLGKIIGIELLHHWYLIILCGALVWLLVKGYRHIPVFNGISKTRYYVQQIAMLAVFAALIIIGIRGGTMTKASRPISVNDAQLYVDDASKAGAVLNTPFAIIRTIGGTIMETPKFFDNEAEMAQYYSPIHVPSDSLVQRKKNVVIIIVEGLSREFMGKYNESLDGGRYKGYTPFLDSLMMQSLYFERSFSNSGFSIDAPPSVLASIPRMDRPFPITPFSLNHLSSIARELKNWGYESSFFHGAENGSLNIESFTHSIGFDNYLGRTEYLQDARFGGDKDFDGTWGIWDEEFLQFFSLKMNEMKQPFVSAVFTLTSHHPYSLPKRYEKVFPDEGSSPVFKCVRYSDYAIKQFFATAQKQAWYENTLFVITADHASPVFAHDEYGNSFGRFRVPIIFYDPTGEMPRGERDGIVQQIDIMPTLLNYMGYNRQYFAFGKDVLNCEATDAWAMNWDHFPQFIMGDYVLQHNGKKPTGYYNYVADPLLRNNLLGKGGEHEKMMQKKLEAFIQTFVTRMKNDNVMCREM